MYNLTKQKALYPVITRQPQLLAGRYVAEHRVNITDEVVYTNSLYMHNIRVISKADPK